MKTDKYFNQRKWILPELPENIMVESVMGCNLSCGMCPVPNAKKEMNGRKPTVMSLSVFKRILADIKDHSSEVHLNQMGEPLLNKNIVEFIRLAKKDKHKVSLTTNGTLMNKELAQEILLAGIDKINFSVDGYHAETYEKIRLGAKYNVVRSNIEMFYQLKKKLKKRTFVQIDCIYSELTKNEISDMRKYWENKIDYLNIIYLDDWGGKLKLPDNFGNIKKESFFSCRYPCDLLWNIISISAEGYVMYCCQDYKLFSALPNIKEKSLKEIWHDEISKERKKHVENKIDSNPCLYCTAWKKRKEFHYTGIAKRLLSFIHPKYKNILKNIVLKYK